MSHIHIVVVFHDKVVYYKQLALHCVLAHIELQHIFHKVLFLHGYRVQADILSDKMLELIR